MGCLVKICKFVFIFDDLIFEPRVIKKREKIEGSLVGNITKNVIVWKGAKILCIQFLGLK
jgi:hypothetical protein